MSAFLFRVYDSWSSSHLSTLLLTEILWETEYATCTCADEGKAWSYQLFVSCLTLIIRIEGSLKPTVYLGLYEMNFTLCTQAQRGFLRMQGYCFGDSWFPLGFNSYLHLQGFMIVSGNFCGVVLVVRSLVWYCTAQEWNMTITLSQSKMGKHYFVIVLPLESGIFTQMQSWMLIWNRKYQGNSVYFSCYIWPRCSESCLLVQPSVRSWY